MWLEMSGAGAREKFVAVKWQIRAQNVTFDNVIIQHSYNKLKVFFSSTFYLPLLVS